ncbi:N-acetyl-gamma-glutamyl-phosphate reductase [Rhodohalobacter mucosus]|uniref:N-acetyl-gamma-glutamyl-phosphate reductase n=1 Tax=Rhodohalobacter mucosus TaxID=2079485 RepID=A0A316TRE9_9BACT|nr:N-acetyl-gamma-glutamyl-phosphate reductase [Rhodohalobacter mucosus]PWN07183.1 N-acetyl-gamma-glutamyl-phosphate reductase [Rhodohalobacter mucosus]
MPKFKVGIVGATGYTGSELLRLLIHHPDITIECVTSETHAGKRITDIHPHLLDISDIRLESSDNISDYDLDLVFLALPHGVSMSFVKEHGLDKFLTVDLSGDFRLPNKKVYEKWYKKKHVAETYFENAVFGLPELYRHEIRNARLVANPGCYPTSAILPLTPLVKYDMIQTSGIVVDSKSGVTGAGAKAKPGTHFPDLFGNFSAYGLTSHRHTPEIESVIHNYTGYTTEVLFSPHLLPIDRGILTTTYSTPKKEVSKEMVEELFYSVFEKEHFIRVVDRPPLLKHVRGSNYCDVHVTYDERTNKIITVSTIDNLMKGAAGQAVQNMNIMFGLIESTGLQHIPLNP